MDKQPQNIDVVGLRIDPEAGKGKTITKRRYFPSVPSIFRILSVCIIFISITTVVAGCISGDWEASSCVIATLLFLETFVWLEKIKIQEMQQSQHGYRGWNISLGINNRGINRLLYAWAGIGADGALLG